VFYYGDVPEGLFRPDALKTLACSDSLPNYVKYRLWLVATEHNLACEAKSAGATASRFCCGIEAHQTHAQTAKNTLYSFGVNNGHSAAWMSYLEEPAQINVEKGKHPYSYVQNR